jgi:hypothetical protein
MNPVALQLELYVCDWQQFMHETGIYVSWYTYVMGKEYFDEYTYAMLTDEPVWITKNRTPMPCAGGA